MTYTWDGVVRLVPTIVPSLLLTLILWLPDQILELYLIDIDTWREASWLAFAGALLLPVTLFALVIVFLLLGSTYVLSLDPPLNIRSSGATLVRALVVIISMAPLVGLLCGLRNAAHQIPRIEQIDPGAFGAIVAEYKNFVQVALISLVPAVAAVVWRMRETLLSIAQCVFSFRAALAGSLLLLAFIAALVISPSQLPLALGSLNIVLIFILAVGWTLILLSKIFRATGWPVGFIAGGLVLIFSTAGWNDNHRVQWNYTSRPMPLEASFGEWFASRKDRLYFEEHRKAYPVYVIAAEGGGIYAGYHLASFLARLQQQCPIFAQHVFAISSVSGGSLGAAHFAAQVGQVDNAEWKACSSEPIEGELTRGAAKFFGNDFLAPLLAATLFPDLLQRVLPFPVHFFDRARGLERAFVGAWESGTGASALGNPFEKTLDEIWSTKGAAPVLFLNTTNVSTGSRVTLSSINFATTPTAMHVSDALCAGHPKPLTLPLVSAVSLSARFPWVTPAGWLERDEARSDECGGQGDDKSGQRNRLYLADGGYFENSGLETANELVRRLRHFSAACTKAVAEKANERPVGCRDDFALPLEIRTIMVFTMDEFFERMLGQDTELTAAGTGELYGPLKTLLNTRSSRTRAVHTREWLFDENMNVKNKDLFYPIPNSRLRFGTREIHQVMLDGTKFFLPLGWRLSKRSMANIASGRDGSVTIATELIRRELMAQNIDDLLVKKRPQ